MTITEAFAIYEARELVARTEKTRKNYCTSRSSIIRALGDMPIELIGEEHIFKSPGLALQMWCLYRDHHHRHISVYG